MGISNGCGTLAGMLCPIVVENLTQKGVGFILNLNISVLKLLFYLYLYACFIDINNVMITKSEMRKSSMQNFRSILLT